MFYVYVLRDTAGKIYIGYTSDLKRRLAQHKSGHTYTTSRMSEPELFYYEAYNSEDLAKIREKKLKQFGSSYQGLFKRLGLKI